MASMTGSEKRFHSPSSRYIWSSSCGSCLMLTAKGGGLLSSCRDDRPLSGTFGCCGAPGLVLPLPGAAGVMQWVGEKGASLGVEGCEVGEEEEELLGG